MESATALLFRLVWSFECDEDDDGALSDAKRQTQHHHHHHHHEGCQYMFIHHLASLNHHVLKLHSDPVMTCNIQI